MRSAGKAWQNAVEQAGKALCALASRCEHLIVAKRPPGKSPGAVAGERNGEHPQVQ